MCEDNLLDVLMTGGDLNTVKPTNTDNLSSANESANSNTYYYEISSKKPSSDKSNTSDKE